MSDSSSDFLKTLARRLDKNLAARGHKVKRGTLLEALSQALCHLSYHEFISRQKKNASPVRIVIDTAEDAPFGAVTEKEGVEVILVIPHIRSESSAPAWPKSPPSLRRSSRSRLTLRRSSGFLFAKSAWPKPLPWWYAPVTSKRSVRHTS